MIICAWHIQDSDLPKTAHVRTLQNTDGVFTVAGRYVNQYQADGVQWAFSSLRLGAGFTLKIEGSTFVLHEWLTYTNSILN